MQTLKLTIPGSYYDSQIYSGRLYLWSNEGSIVTLDWNGLMDSVIIPDHLRLALRCAFQRSEYLYGDRWELIFQDMEIKNTIQRKFQELAEKPIEVSEDDVRRFVIREQDNPLPFPHADCTIYNNTLFIGSQSGVLGATCNPKNKFPINPKPSKLWDGSVLGLAASYSTLALSAGSEGLFEYSLNTGFLARDHEELHEPHQLIKQDSNSVRWLYASVFSSSYFNEGYLADFVIKKEKDDEELHQQRKLREIFPSSAIFGHQTKNGVPTFAWGVHDKICFATKTSIEVVQYNPYKDTDKRFITLGSVGLNELHSDIVSADSALFGFVIEGDNGLLVIDSQLESMWIEGEPVNWRVFSKSKFYTNQLHILYDDHLCIHSFNHDYFVDQETKKVGIRLPKEFPYKAGRARAR